ncbi:potassium/proton antiporter [Dermatophilaceae bacterium Sec6.4]
MFASGVSAVAGSFGTDDLAVALMVGSVVLLVSIAAVRLATRSGLPTLLLYLAIGAAIGEAGLGINFENPRLTQVLGYSALILILTEGGLSTRWSTIKRSVAPAAVLSTVGVLVSISVIAVAAHFLLDLPWQIGLLLGAIVSSTDAAAVFSVLRNVPLPARLTGVLEAESGFNDAPVVLIVVALAHAATPGADSSPWWVVLVIAVVELVGGAVVGVAVGWGLGTLFKKASVGSSGLFSIGVVAICVLSYAGATLVHTSGFIACYLTALVLGNLDLPHRSATLGFGQALGWLAQIGLFVLLGLLASPSRLEKQFLPALVIGLVLLLVARPLSILASMSWFGFRWREQVFLSWAGLRGAVPVVLATVPLTVGTPRTEWIFDLVFVLVVVFTLLQAPTLPALARYLGLIVDSQALDVQVESTALEELHAEMLQVRVGPHSRLHGVEVHELRLPPGANLTMIVRDNASFVPGRRDALRHGDQLLLVTTAATRAHAVRRIRTVSAGGRLAEWRRRPSEPH